jgi:hypothetical protein
MRKKKLIEIIKSLQQIKIIHHRWIGDRDCLLVMHSQIAGWYEIIIYDTHIQLAKFIHDGVYIFHSLNFKLYQSISRRISNLSKNSSKRINMDYINQPLYQVILS